MMRARQEHNLRNGQILVYSPLKGSIRNFRLLTALGGPGHLRCKAAKSYRPPYARMTRSLTPVGRDKRTREAPSSSAVSLRRAFLGQS